MINSTTILSVDDVRLSLQKFGWIDYLVFVLMLIGCALIGIYFAFKMKYSKSSNGEDDYLVGGRTMKIFPITLSLIASLISGIFLLGTPTEIYIYGIQYFYILGGVILMTITMSYIYLPVFHEMKLTSTYEYLEARFDKRVRLFGSVMFVLGTMTWLPIVIYVPALAFNQATGINVHFITPAVCLVCIFYTLVGGIKAVVWTDVVQTFLMFGAMGLVVIKGTIDAGGLDLVWERAWNSGRIEAPDFSTSLITRHTFWSLVIGGGVHWLKSNAISQNMIQRYLSLPTLKDARRALYGFFFGVSLILLFCCYSGLLIFARYHDCDPLTTNLAKAKDQVLPLLVMEILEDYPGLPGIFVAGVFSAALSSLSTALNSMAAVVLEDFIKNYYKKSLTDRQVSIIMRTIVFICGLICFSLVFIVEKLGTVLQLSASLGAISNGPLLGIFTSGILLPWIEGKGVLIGGIISLTLMSWICIQAQADIASGNLVFPTKPLKTEGCYYTFIPVYIAEANLDKPFAIHHVSYIWYTFMGASITVIIAIIISLIIGRNNTVDVDQKLLAPFVRKLILKKNYTIEVENSKITKTNFNGVDNLAFDSTIHLKNFNNKLDETI